MIYGTGVDMVETARIEAACARQHFKTRVFTEEERRQAERRSERLAGDFAVKEAVAKAFGTGVSGFELHDIACLRDEKGAPYVRLSGGAAALAQKCGIKQIHVSISNTKTCVIAFAVLETELQEEK